MKDVIETPHLCVRSRFLPPITYVLGHLDQPNPPVTVLKVQVSVGLLTTLAPSLTRPRGPIAGHFFTGSVALEVVFSESNDILSLILRVLKSTNEALD